MYHLYTLHGSLFCLTLVPPPALSLPFFLREDEDHPGLTDYEASFLRLLDKLCNGTRVDINHTGTVVKYKPGLLIGGKITHDCPPSRAIGYFLEAIICMAPFAKKPFALTLTGVTNNEQDPSVDVLRTVTLPLIRRFGVEDGLELKVSGFFFYQPYPFSLQVVALDFFLYVHSSILGRVV